MKFFVLLSCLFVFASNAVVMAFTTTTMPQQQQQQKSLIVLQARPDDSSKEIANALRISREFGSTSKEARLAWETVEEEMEDASDLSPAMNNKKYKKKMATKNIDTDNDDNANNNNNNKEEETNYKVQLLALNRLLSNTKEQLHQIQTLAFNLQQLELQSPSVSKLPDTASGLKTVLQEAKAASEVYGPESPEAELAWNEVDFCTDVMGGVECHVDSVHRYSAAALNAHHLYDSVVDATLFQEAQEAIDVLDNVQRFVRIEASRLKNLSSSSSPSASSSGPSATP